LGVTDDENDVAEELFAEEEDRYDDSDNST